jgi:hypothetical protein
MFSRRSRLLIQRFSPSSVGSINSVSTQALPMATAVNALSQLFASFKASAA